jgi:pimeloyl-ACP methyl ester carboxylesterase
MKTSLTLKIEDATEIAFDHYKMGNSGVIVLAHGFFNNKDAYLFKKIAEMFSKEYDVISFDFRGHGKSEGKYTWTFKEEEDLRAIILYAKEKGYKKIGVIGFSLGAAVTLIEASKNSAIDSIIAVSTPYDFRKMDFHFWEKEMLNDLKLNLGFKGKGKGIRPGNLFLKKTRPIDVINKLAPKPVLFIHGEKDWLIKPYHSQKLFEMTKEPKKIYIVKEAGHAEKIFDDHKEEFEQACKDWFNETLRVQK